MRRVSVTVLLMMVTLAVAACNTVKGAGRDIQSVGEAGEEALDSVKN